MSADTTTIAAATVPPRGRQCASVFDNVAYESATSTTVLFHHIFLPHVFFFFFYFVF